MYIQLKRELEKTNEAKINNTEERNRKFYKHIICACLQ